MSVAGLNRIHEREVADRRRATLYLLCLMLAIAVVVIALALPTR